MATMTLNDNSKWQPTDEQMAKWRAAFQAVDVDQELLAASAWLDSNPTRRKTSRGIARFCNTWLSRAQDKGGRSGLARDKSGEITASRDMTSLDELTMNFTNCPDYRAYCLQKYGQCFENGKRITA